MKNKIVEYTYDFSMDSYLKLSFKNFGYTSINFF